MPSPLSNSEGDPRHKDSDTWEKPPSVLEMEHFCRVNDLILQERADDLLLIKDDDPDRPVNVLKDPVLSVVIACRKTDLALRFIEKLRDVGRLQHKNYFGDTALHVAAAINDHRVVKALVLKNPDIVGLQNDKHETALHRAALNGHRRMFWWLVNEGKSSVFSRMKDGSTVLHCAIMGNASVLALEIAKEYENLITSRKVNAMTPLQLMVTIPDLFRSKLVLGTLDELIYNWIPIEVDQYSIRRPWGDEEDTSAKATRTHNRVGAIKEDDDDLLWKRIRKSFPSSYATILDFVELIIIPAACWTRTILFNVLRLVIPRIQSLERKKKKHKEVMELTAILAQPRFMEFHEWGKSGANKYEGSKEFAEDVMPWKEPCSIFFEEQYQNPVPQISENAKEDEGSSWKEPPLILGAQMGLDDFVEKILQVCPESIAYLDTKKRSVVRVAIESGSPEVVRIIDKMARRYNPMLLSWFYSHVDGNTRNTILHFASMKNGGGGDAIQLYYEIKWFEMVKKIVPRELWNYRNNEEKTAQELFSEKHKPMVVSCKKELVEMAKTCSSLVAAVVFASSFSIPGEKNPDTGNPLYFDRLPFKVFSHAYVVGFGCAATSLVLFLSLLITPCEERDFRLALPLKYFLACLSFATVLLAFLISFACNIFLQIYGGQRTSTKDLIPLLLELAVFPVVCFILLHNSGDRFGPPFSRLWAAA